MAISLDQIIKINGQSIAAQSTQQSLALNILSKNALIPSSTPVLVFLNLAQVQAYFGISSVEYAMAQVYFKGFDGSLNTPNELLISWYHDTDVSGFLAGGKPAANSVIAAITNGSIEFHATDNTGAAGSVTISGLDFSTVPATPSNFAALISAELAADSEWNNLSVVYNNIQGRYYIYNGITGALAQVDFCTDGDVAAAFGFQFDSVGAVVSPGIDALTPDEVLAKIIEYNSNWASLTYADGFDLSEQEAIGLYIAALTGSLGNYIYFPWTTNPAATNPGDTTQIGGLLKDQEGVAPIFGDQLIAAFAGAIGASIDYTSSTITFAFKNQTGLTPSVTDSDIATNLLANGYDFLGNYANKSIEERYFQNGQVFGIYKWLDAKYNQNWISNELQTSIADMFSLNLRVSYDPQGLATIRAALTDVMNAALTNGVAEPNLTLDTQIERALEQQGCDTRALFNVGYFIQIVPAPPEVRAARQSPLINIWFTYGGAVQQVVVNTTMAQ